MKPPKITKTAAGHSVRLRYGQDRRGSFEFHDPEQAQQRANVMAELSIALIAAGKGELAEGFIREAAKALNQDTLVMLRGLVNDACHGAAVVVRASTKPTFRTVGEAWTSNDLHRKYPDHVRKIDHSLTLQRLEYIYAVIGSIPIDRVTRADCDEAMRKVPGDRSVATRRAYAQIIHRVLALAELAGYIERNPLPKGWLPKTGPKKDYPILLPKEEGTLLGCTRVPLGYRIWYGWQYRTGMRMGETVALRWSDLDLENGVVQLDENKTDHARWFKLEADLAEAMRLWHRLRGKPGADALVFAHADGLPFSIDHQAGRVRAHLLLAGVDRHQLHHSGKNRLRFGQHGFRHSFVTLHLALGRNET